MPRVVMVAGEASGDLLGAGLIRALKARNPRLRFEGVAGPQMIAEGCVAIYPMEKLAVMGITEVLSHYRELRRIRADLARRYRADPPDVFVGVDAPDFNLGLEQRLKQAGVPTVHYVSPTVWAWRRYRLRKITRSVDLMLTLFPFETDIYRESGVEVRYCGHPLADEIGFETDRAEARRALDLPESGEVVALLPGSRVTEIKALGETFLRAAERCLARRPGLRFVVPMISGRTRALFETLMTDAGIALPLTVVEGRSRTVMAAADVVLLASGTATLEALLLKRPMVTAYRLTPVSYWIISHLARVQYYTLPNLLAGRGIVPELIQAQAEPEALATAVLDYLEDPGRSAATIAEFQRIHERLRQGASERAADAVMAMLGKGQGGGR